MKYFGHQEVFLLLSDFFFQKSVHKTLLLNCNIIILDMLNICLQIHGGGGNH